MTNNIMNVLDLFRKSLQADGADLQVLETNERNLKLELIISEHTCLDCIVSQDIMQSIIVSQLEKNGLKFNKVELVYPEI